MYNDLKDKVALITGGASGIGKAIAERYAEEGMKVVINYHSREDEASELVESIKAKGGEAVAVKADTTNEEEFLSLFQKTIDTYGALHVMVNNAGMQKDIVSHEMSTDEFDKVMNVNLRGTFIGSREAIKHYMEKKYKGVVINVSSVHEIIPWPHYAQYCASKGGVKLLTQSLALEYARVQIRVNNIAPGSINTPINAENFSTEEKKKEADGFVPMGYVAEPEEIASIAAFLASKESKYITGQTIVADGGLSLYPSHRNWEYDELAESFTDEIK
ncbi:glucose 1-dehydrogenase [Macrococcus brunensis]|uniref:Diacetyl reductase [(S)-acetoin forming] n=1 Tax=Macrococcus brunensis TaxID=198483 RepID=A0A4R6BEV4_9STAP|nr:glucose 1-dehydrogenase [Macrococcus brunensis]TDL98309.1 glucose 1-dehydrogenase [Macrococcus brunensis]ULG71551.1 glucose 1-dehydrogenase [Macrococcus brunensis]ULG73815.1 glucose 1-dehydrogenase [Macrococcus brunensis]